MILVDTREPDTVLAQLASATNESIASCLLPWGDIWITPWSTPFPVPAMAADLFALLPAIDTPLASFMEETGSDLPAIISDTTEIFLSWLSARCLTIESKTPGDFFNTWRGDRLDAQVMRMIAGSRSSLVMIKGRILPSSASIEEVLTSEGAIAWNYWGFINKTISLGLSGAPVIQIDKERFPSFIAHLAKWYRSERELVKPPKPRAMIPLSKEAAFLCGFPGIGPKLAVETIQWTGLLKDALCALVTPESLDLPSHPKGLGVKRIAANRAFLGLEHDESLSINIDAEDANG